ncbi:hypothetical protein ACWWD9_08205 [Methylovorus sp. SPW-M1]
MMKSLATFCVYLLLVTLPMQSVAAVSLPLIQAISQSQEQLDKESMPCHDHMFMASGMSAPLETGKAACKDTCAAVCLALGSLGMALCDTALPLLFSSTIQIGSTELIYVSVIPANLFRPPISLS